MHDEGAGHDDGRRRDRERRLPVIDGTEVVGMLSQADIAVNLPDGKVGDLVEVISAAP